MISEELFTHEYLWRCSLALSQVEPDAMSEYHLALPSQLMTAAAFEAFVNFCGHALLPEIWANERENFKGKGLELKIKCVADSLPTFEWKKGEYPYQAIRELLGFRDFVVHGKVHSSTYEAGETDDRQDFRFQLPFHSFLTLESADTSRTHVRKFSQSIVEAARRLDDHHLHFHHDAFNGPLGSGAGSMPYVEQDPA